MAVWGRSIPLDLTSVRAGCAGLQLMARTVSRAAFVLRATGAVVPAGDVVRWGMRPTP